MNYFPTPLQKVQFYDKYSRWNDELGRRETWEETINRAVDFLYELGGDRIESEVYEEIRQAILNMEVMPSMRLLAMAGPAARRQNLSIYNCSFTGIDNIKAFGEALLISMSSCGVGFSVEKKYIEQLPELPELLQIGKCEKFIIEDTTEGWQEAIDHLFEVLYSGFVPRFDFSFLRPKGAVLKTKGGRASGPEVLQETIEFIAKTFLLHYSPITEITSERNQIHKLTSIQAHDIMCAIGNCAVSGGMRRTAMISLFDKDDKEMLNAKSGNYNNYRWNANNSMVFSNRITQSELIKWFGYLEQNQRGEPGLFSLENAQHTAPERRTSALIAGTNPCGEINLRNKQLCNLSAVIARENDTEEDLFRKIRLATIAGTIQATATYFPGLSEQWKRNCEKERLIGVDITGQMDCTILNQFRESARIREELRNHAIKVNGVYSYILGISQSTAVTCCKPSGNTSQLVDCSSGIHPRFAKYYIRRIRISVSSPIFKVLYHSGLDFVAENGQTNKDMTTAVFSFPIKSPSVKTRVWWSATDMCEFWRVNKEHYTEHNPSVTINYKPNEILDVINWLWDNKDIVGGMSFLPYDGAKYDNMPYEEISEETYEKMVNKMPEIKWELLEEFEKEDRTTSSQEVACSSGICDL